jgi:hypothetical protein
MSGCEILGDRRMDPGGLDSEPPRNPIDIGDAVVSADAQQGSGKDNDLVGSPAAEDPGSDVADDGRLFVPQLAVAAEVEDAFRLPGEELLDRRRLGHTPEARISSLHIKLGFH